MSDFLRCKAQLALFLCWLFYFILFYKIVTIILNTIGNRVSCIQHSKTIIIMPTPFTVSSVSPQHLYPVCLPPRPFHSLSLEWKVLHSQVLLNLNIFHTFTLFLYILFIPHMRDHSLSFPIPLTNFTQYDTPQIHILHNNKLHEQTFLTA